MRLSAAGDALAAPQSGGAGNVSINGAIPAALVGCSGGGWCWSGNDICYGQGNFGAGQHLYKYVVSTTTLTQIDPLGANLSAAGNGVVAAWLTGVRFPLSTFGPFPAAGLGDVSPDGVSALVQNYAAATGLITFSVTGTPLATVSVNLRAGYFIRAKDGVMAYQDAAGTHLRNLVTGALLPYAPQTATTYQTVPVNIGGTRWVLEATDQLIFRPATSSQGYLIATGNTFSVDVIELSAGVARIGWAVGAGETPTQIRMADLTVDTGAVMNGTTASGAPVFTPGTPLTTSSFPVGPVQGGTALGRLQPRYALKADSFVGGEDGKRIYQRWWEEIANQAFAGANLAQSTGILPADQGGTGMDTGLTVLDGSNVIADTTQLDTAQTFGPFVLGTGRSMVLASPTAIDSYIQLDGTAELVVI